MHDLKKKTNLFAMLLLALLAIGTALYWYQLLSSYDRMRQSTITRAETMARQLANGLAEQMASVVRNINFVSNVLRQDYLIAPGKFQDSVNAAFAAFPKDALIQVAVIDRQGYLAYSNLATPRVYLGDREHFRIHADHPDHDTPFVSKPLQGRVSKSWSIQFSRPIRRDGHFAGVLVLSISPEYLSRTLEGLSLDRNDSAGLIRMDGSYLARSRDIASFVGKKVKETRPYLAADAAADGVFSDESSHEPVRRIFAWRRMNDSDQLVVYAGISQKDILLPIENEISQGLTRNAIGTLLLLILAGIIVRQGSKLKRQHEQLRKNELLYRSFFDRHSAVKLLIDGKTGRIQKANNAAASFYGYACRQLEQMTVFDLNFLPESDLKERMSAATDCHSNHFKFKHRLASGDIRDVEVYSSPIEIDGQALLFSIIHDITEQHELELKLKQSEARYREIFATIPNGMMLVDGVGEIVLWNDAALSIQDVDVDALKRRAVKIHYRDGQAVADGDYPSKRAVQEPATHGLYYLWTQGGQKRWIAVHTRRLPNDLAAIDGAVVSFTDVTRLIALEESLLISQSVFEAAAEGIIVTEPDGTIVKVNPAFTELTGYAEHEALGETPAILASGRHAQDFYSDMYLALNTTGNWDGEITNRRKDGRLFVEKLKISSVRNPRGELLRYVGLISDITAQKEQEAEVWFQAHHDALTGLPNRNLFQDRLGQAIAHAQRRNKRVGLLFIDLDHFKPVNDTYGHPAGDELLCQVSERIADCLREEDTVARIGGDEFVVLLPMINAIIDCVTVAEKILASLNLPFTLSEARVSISASLGIACCKRGGCTAAELMEHADQAMYEAKKARNGYAVADEHCAWPQTTASNPELC